MNLKFCFDFLERIYQIPAR